jgi:xanthine/uracil permease
MNAHAHLDQPDGTAGSTASRTIGEPLLIGIHQRLPWWQCLVYGFQVLLADGLTALVLPVLLGRALHLSPAQTTGTVAASLLGAGLVTIGQSLFVMKMPILQGPAIVFISVMAGGAAVYGPAAMWTGMWISALVVALLSWPLNVLPRMRGFITRAPVYGTFLILVSMVIGQAIFQQIAGQPGTPHHNALLNYVIAALPMLVAIAISVFLPSSVWRLLALLIGAALAIAIATLSGYGDYGPVGDASWFRLPSPLPFGFDFKIQAVLLVFIGYFVNLFESIGTFKVFCEDIAGEQLTKRKASAGVFIEGAGSFVAALFGGMGTTTYTQNIGSIVVTRIGSRFTVTGAGVILVAMAFIGKLGAAVASLPGPVIGGLLLATVAMMLMQGVRVVGTMRPSPASLYAVGAGVLVAVGILTSPPQTFVGIPLVWRPFVDNALVVGLAVSVVIFGAFEIAARAGRRRSPREVSTKPGSVGVSPHSTAH